MKRGSFVLAGAIVLAAELALNERMSFLGASPDLLLVLLVLSSGALAPEEAVPRGFFCGLATDLFFGRRLGAFAVSYALCAEALSGLRPYVFADHPVTRLGSMAAAAILAQWAGLALNSLGEGAAPPGSVVLSLEVALVTFLAGACAAGAMELARVTGR